MGWLKKKNKQQPAPVANPYARPGPGSDPAPYVSENNKGWVARVEPLPAQWRRLAVHTRSQDFDNGLPFTKQEQDLAHTHVQYGVAPLDDQHDSPHFADDPYQARPPKPIRQRLAPRAFQQTNDSVQTAKESWGGHGSHALNGTHFSMAANVRTYPIGGMAPVVSRRNTYRLVPPPVDINRQDLPPSGTRFQVPSTVTVGDFPAATGIRKPTSRLR